jgi:hypothetical protein
MMLVKKAELKEMELVLWLGWPTQLLGVHLAGLLMHCRQVYEMQGLYAFHLSVDQNKRMHPNILPISFSVNTGVAL